MSWCNFLDKVVSEMPNKLALVDQNTKRRLTYKDLDEEVSRITNYLISKNVIMGSRVILIDTNSLEHVTYFLACARIGAIFVPMNWRLGDAEKVEIIERVRPTLILVRGHCHLNIKNYEMTDLNSINISSFSSEKFIVQTDENDPLLMLFTSGSTGMPKGVLLHGKMLSSNQEQTVQNWGLVQSDRTLVETPFFHTGGYNVLLLPLLSIGGTCILAKGFNTENFFHTLLNETITVYFGVPTMFNDIINHDMFTERSLASLRFIISGGAYCDAKIIKAFKEKGLLLKQGFGLTEVGPNCFLLEDKDALRKIGSIGKPMPHSDVKIIKDDKEVQENEIGELLIKGPHVCLSYFENHDLYQKSLYHGYFKTGDLAKIDEDGYYYIVGRIKDMYISGGENVYPAEVEKKINSHPLIKESVVVAAEDERWGEVGVAYYTGKEISLNELRNYLNPLLSRYKHPHRAHVLENFPLLDNGKVDRNKLKAMAQNRH